ncbi:MAG: SBBP repeat-containing protein [Bacteroidia bacterium]
MRKLNLLLFFLSVLSIDCLAQDLRWEKKFTGSVGGSQYASSVVMDDSGNVYVAGEFVKTLTLETSQGPRTLSKPDQIPAIFILKMDPDGNLIWIKQINATYVIGVSSMGIDHSGNIYITGSFEGTSDFDPGEATYFLTFAGTGFGDIFVLKLNSSGNFIWAKKVGGNYNDFSSSMTLDHKGHIYITGGFQDKVDFDPDVAK